jgi:GrpB-like predicted nucleotidyltransferase (UPF0157 family)
MQKIEVIGYDPSWPMQYEAEKKLLETIMLDNCEAIHHVGSTSVPGMMAKPILDIILVAHNRERAIREMETTEYSYRGEWNIPLKCGFTKIVTPSVNLHMFFDKNHPEIELNLLFRDYLRTHNTECDEYIATKMKILRAEDAQERVGKLSMPIYTIRKRSFIDSIIAKTGFDRLRVLKCITHEERNYASQFFSDSLDQPDHEHFILYKGIEMAGYAFIKLDRPLKKASIPIITASNTTFKEEFVTVIKTWLSVHGFTE